MTKNAKSSPIKAAFAVCIIAACFCLYRSSIGFVWDDSPHLVINKYERQAPLSLSAPHWPARIISKAFGEVTPSGYRPLSAAIDLLGTTVFSSSDRFEYAWFLAVGLIIGLLCHAAYAVSLRFVKTRPAALLAVFLFICSSPFVSGSWIVFAGIQAIVPLLICWQLLLYWKIRSDSAHKPFFVALLCLLYFVGPWFREFIGMAPLMIILLELRSRRRPTLLACLSALFFLHALYPTTLIRLFFYHNLPAGSIFAIGSLGEQMVSAQTSAGWLQTTINSLRWQACVHYLTLFGPILIALLLVDYLGATLGLLFCRKQTDANAPESPQSIRILARAGRFLLASAYIAALILGYAHFYDRRYFWLALVMLFALQGLRQDAFLAVWFLLFFLPFLKVFTEQVHLAYCMLPASIITAAAIERMYFWLGSTWRLIRPLRYALSGILLLVLVDHGLNVYGSWKVVNGIYDGTVASAEWLRDNVPRDSILVANAIHCEDLRLYNDNWMQTYFTVRAGLPRPHSGDMIDPNNLSKLLRDNMPQHKVYFLALDFDYTPEKVKYHSHKYVRDNAVPMRDLGVIHTTSVQYPYLDPFKAWIPREYVSFLGPPDLENDFYRGPSLSGRPLTRQVFAEYHLYEVTAPEVRMPRTQ